MSLLRRVAAAGGAVLPVEHAKIEVHSAANPSMPSSAVRLELAFGLDFNDLYRREGLERVDRAFRQSLLEADAALAERYEAARAAPDTLAYKAEAELLMAVSPHFDRFVARLFAIEDEWQDLHESHHAL